MHIAPRFFVRRVVAASATSFVILSACDGGGGSTSSSGGAGTADTFATEYCKLFSGCCAKIQKTYDEAKCRATIALFTGSASYDAAKGQTCLDAARAEASSPTFCDGASDATSEKCSVVFSSGGGSRQPGETCSAESDCASSPDGDVQCATSFSGGATTKVCQVLVRGQDGASDCIGYKDGNITSTSLANGTPPARAVICFTADGLFCNEDTKKCERSRPVGGECTTTSAFACDKSAYCDSTTKRCVARKAAGETCAAKSECADGTYCDTDSKTCKATIPIGESCTKSDQCGSKASCTNGKCATSSSATTALFCN